MKNSLNLNQLGLENLSQYDLVAINGGDTNGLMTDGTHDKAWNQMVNGISTTAGFVVGFFKGLLS
ncbi:hypothetical protein [Mucilaginibacter sp. KACC 22063]|uniref:hypothetical protein n=1 Tax=Mucilaginibacter sp. KACC 22063 TaxID=3025666 RepID=UPI002364FD05|nr:hypothetical protein [Mucilaginibacter sp. KACC 22063]WDF54879.1 hypothetical protein PQ461_18275 [Mucilaginibacter sp. KACC 22063]